LPISKDRGRSIAETSSPTADAGYRVTIVSRVRHRAQCWRSTAPTRREMSTPLKAHCGFRQADDLACRFTDKFTGSVFNGLIRMFEIERAALPSTLSIGGTPVIEEKA
jgi:hypothetical protein